MKIIDAKVEIIIILLNMLIEIVPELFGDIKPLS